MDIEAYLPNAFENIEYYIMYVPEGYGIDGDLPFKHPEWIMAYKFVGTANTSSDSQTVSRFTPPRIKTRLSRLNTGDSIILLINGFANTELTNVRFNGLLRWWTKTN